VQAVIVLVDGMFFQERKRIAQLAASARLSAVYGFREHVDAGGLISYGVNLADNFRRAPQRCQAGVTWQSNFRTNLS
jgi:putative ABC transport system substrate-binding protein